MEIPIIGGGLATSTSASDLKRIDKWEKGNVNTKDEGSNGYPYTFDWKKRDVKSYQEKLCNLVILERKLNQNVSDRFFK